MAYNTWDIGDSIRVRSIFTVNNIPQDPSTVTLMVKKPNGSILNITGTTRNGTGDYYYDLLSIDQSGQWWYRFEGTGLIAAGEAYFLVRKSTFYVGV